MVLLLAFAVVAATAYSCCCNFCPSFLYQAENTEFKYDWSYIVAWVGVASALCSAILFSLAAVCIKNDREREEAMNMQYLMPGEMWEIYDTFVYTLGTFPTVIQNSTSHTTILFLETSKDIIMASTSFAS